MKKKPHNLKDGQQKKKKKHVHFSKTITTLSENVIENEKQKEKQVEKIHTPAIKYDELITESEIEIDEADTDSGTITFVPASVDIEEDIIEKDSLSNISFGQLDNYNLNRLPWPIKNKYLLLLKEYDFPFEKLGKFKNQKPKKTKQTEDNFYDYTVHRTLHEGNLLFNKTGYEDELARWLAYFWRQNPNNCSKYTAHNQLSEIEYNRLFEELKNNLAYENELAFELQQIKLLCGTIDEDNYGLDGSPKKQWDAMINNKKINQEYLQFRDMVKQLKQVNHEIIEEKKRIKKEKQNKISAKREQTLKDLALWKNYVSPEMEDFLREKPIDINDGRVKDWFETVYLHEVGGRQAPTRLIEISDLFEEQQTIFDKESISNIMDYITTDD